MRNENYEDLLDEYKREQAPIVLTAAEAMDILGVGKNTMYRLLNSGRLKGTRVGRVWKIELTNLNALLSSVPIQID